MLASITGIVAQGVRTRTLPPVLPRGWGLLDLLPGPGVQVSLLLPGAALSLALVAPTLSPLPLLVLACITGIG